MNPRRLASFAFCLVLTCSISCSGQNVEVWDDGDTDEILAEDLKHPLARFEKDDSPPFQIDGARPFTIHFGRGSGYAGLNTMKITEDGTLVLHRRKYRARSERTEITWRARPSV